MYSLEIPQRITKELLLSKNYTQETYFEHYLGIQVKKGLFVSPSVIRTDHKPTCAFFKDKRGVLRYKDFAGPSFDFVGAVSYIYKCSYYQALKIIANDFGFINIDVPKNLPKIEYSGYVLKETERAKIQVEVQDFSTKELNWWASFGVSEKTLKKYKVYSIKSVFLNGFYHSSSTEKSPIFGYFGGIGVDEIEYWRLYMPTKIKFRFLSNWPAIMLQGVKNLKKESSSLLITKSMKDVMLLYEFGINSIAPNSETVLVTKNQLQKISSLHKSIFVLFDNDLAGVKAANKYKKEYDLPIIFIKRKYAKDISDLYKSISKNQFWLTIEELNSILLGGIKQTKHFYVFNGKKEN